MKKGFMVVDWREKQVYQFVSPNQLHGRAAVFTTTAKAKKWAEDNAYASRTAILYVEVEPGSERNPLGECVVDPVDGLVDR